MRPFMGEQFERETGADSEDQSELIRIALAETIDGVLIHGLDGTIVLFNEAVAKDAGYTPEEYAALPPWGWSRVPAEQRERILARIVKDGAHVFTTDRNLPDGTWAVTEVHARLVETRHGRLIVSITRDVTEKVRAEQMLRELAFHDPLTGLANRAAFDERLQSALASAKRHEDNVAIIYLDLDDFKEINDRYGHQIGDSVLIAIAHRLEGAVRAEDVVARLGGDEFVIILPRLERLEDVDTVAEKIEQSIVKPLKVAGSVNFNLGAAIGIAVYDPERDDERTLVARADLAMYESKKRGGRVPTD